MKRNTNNRKFQISKENTATDLSENQIDFQEDLKEIWEELENSSINNGF